MLAEPFLLNREQAAVIVAQYQETSRIRGYELCVAAVMENHTHLVVGVPGDPDPKLLRDLYKSWATRALKKRWALPANGSFFTRGGSVRKKGDEQALHAAVIYVARDQPNPLATFVGDRWLAVVERFDQQRMTSG
jgi:REP element-mobilizing transposase RayT